MPSLMHAALKGLELLIVPISMQLHFFTTEAWRGYSASELLTTRGTKNTIRKRLQLVYFVSYVNFVVKKRAQKVRS